jgi:RIO kinase 1
MGGYLDGRIGRSIRGRRDILHMMSTPSSMQSFWVNAEYDALEILAAAGLSVPKALGRTGGAVAMEFVAGLGDSEGAAPRLRDTRLDPDQAQRIGGEVLSAIEAMLRLHLIHGDLSPYNILMRGDRPVFIDFPQAVDARYHSQAAAMLHRDVSNVYEYFERKGAAFESSAGAISDRLWDLYYRNRL